jgi:hypothetical protein
MATPTAIARGPAIMRVLVVLVLFGGAVFYTFFVSGKRRLDFHVYYDTSIAIQNGQTDLYSDGPNADPALNYRYPPAFAVLFSPFTQFPPGVARFLWVGLIVAAFFAWVGGIYYYASPPGPYGWPTLIALGGSLLLVGTWSWDSLRYNNAHFVILALMLGALVLSQRRLVILPALLLATAASIKLFPVLMLPYFAIRRQWRFVAVTGVFVVVLNLVPVIYVGFTDNCYLLKEWYNHVIVEDDVYRDHAPENISVKGTFDRLLNAEGLAPKGTEKIKLASWKPEPVKYIYLITAAAVFLAMMLALEYFQRKGIDDGFALHKFALLLCMMIIVGPRTNDYFLAALLVPLTVMILCCFASPTRLNIGILGAIILTSALHIFMPGKERRLLMTLAGWHLFLPFLLGLGMIVNIARATGPLGPASVDREAASAG